MARGGNDAPKGRAHKRHVAQRLAHDHRYQTEILPKRRTTERLVEVARADRRHGMLLAAVVVAGTLGLVTLLVLAWAMHDIWRPRVGPLELNRTLNIHGEKRDVYL